MAYTVKELAEMAKVTVRTLHHYDATNLLKPAYVGSNGYRYYEEEQLHKLQHILFYRELGMSLPQIQKVMERPDFNRKGTLLAHRKKLVDQMRHMDALIETIDNTLKHMEGEKMKDKDLFYGFSSEKQEAYEKEAQELWGDTELGKKLFKQSQENLKDVDITAIQAKGNMLWRDFAVAIDEQQKPEDVPHLFKRLREWLECFYEVDDALLEAMGAMYAENEKFRAFYSNFHPKLPDFLKEGTSLQG